MWYQERKGGVLLFIKVIPGSSRNAMEAYGDFLKVKITAPPEKGKANQALCGFLAKQFKVSQSMVKIVKGRTQSLKIVFVPVRVGKIFSIIK